MQPFTGAAPAGGYHHGEWREDMAMSVGINVGVSNGLERMHAALTSVGAGQLKLDTVVRWRIQLAHLMQQGAALIGKTEADYAELLKAVIDVGPQNVARDKHHYQP